MHDNAIGARQFARRGKYPSARNRLGVPLLEHRLGTQRAGSPLLASGNNFETVMSPDTRAPEYKEADRRMAAEPVVPAPLARQGVTGHNVRYVLGFGIAAIVIAFIIVYLAYFG